MLNQARANGEEFERTLTRYAAERLLFRLGASSARDRCILKGASLLSVWMPDPYRATRDVDVLSSGPSDDTSIHALVAELSAVACPDDALLLDLSELLVEPIRAEEEYSGKRARFHARLGSARVRIQLDIGFGDALAVQPQEIQYPTMLADLPAPRLRGYPREATVAEKFEAMIKLDTRNSRMKDFHDIWALAGSFTFNGPAIQRSIAACFERRGTPWTAEAPRVLTPAFYQGSELETRWRRYLAAGAVLVPPPAQSEVIGERIIAFLGPVRTSVVAGTTLESEWGPGGPWR